jgi:hypothetical protein
MRGTYVMSVNLSYAEGATAARTLDVVLIERRTDPVGFVGCADRGGSGTRSNLLRPGAFRHQPDPRVAPA